MRNLFLPVLLTVLPTACQAVCEELADFSWWVNEPGALDEYVVALDDNGNLYVEGEILESKTIATFLSTPELDSICWRMKNSGGTTVAAVYEDDSTGKFNLVLAGTLLESANFATHSGVSRFFRVLDGSDPLMELKQAGGALTEGTLLIACSKIENRPVGFFLQPWPLETPTPGGTPLRNPVHFAFIPGHGSAMYVVENPDPSFLPAPTHGYSIRYIDEDGVLSPNTVVSLSVAAEPVTRPTPANGGGQHGMMGIAFHPEFAEPTPRPYVYVYATSATPIPFDGDPYRDGVDAYVNKVYRFEVNPQLTPIGTPMVAPGSPIVYAGNVDYNPSERLDHTGGALKSYTDGNKNYLLLTTGCIDHECDSGLMSGRPQDVRVFPGKLLRMEIGNNGALSPASNNPFMGWVAATPVATPIAPIPTPANRSPKGEIIASGFRNPYTMALRPGPTPGVPDEVWVADVGGVADRGFEEINRVSLFFSNTPVPEEHFNYGFPRLEGMNEDPAATITPIPYPTPGFSYYDGNSTGSCPDTGPSGGDLSDFPSFPHVAFENLTPPSIYYERFSAGGSVGGGAFAPVGEYPERYDGNFFFLDFVHGSISMIEDSILDSGIPSRIPTLGELFWWNTTNAFQNRELIESPDGYLYILSAQQIEENEDPTGRIERLWFKSDE